MGERRAAPLLELPACRTASCRNSLALTRRPAAPLHSPPTRHPPSFESANVLHQLRCGGVLEAVRISCAGFPNKRPFPDFVEHFWQLSPELYHNSELTDRFEGGTRGAGRPRAPVLPPCSAPAAKRGKLTPASTPRLGGSWCAAARRLAPELRRNSELPDGRPCPSKARPHLHGVPRPFLGATSNKPPPPTHPQRPPDPQGHRARHHAAQRPAGGRGLPAGGVQGVPARGADGHPGQAADRCDSACVSLCVAACVWGPAKHVCLRDFRRAQLRQGAVRRRPLGPSLATAGDAPRACPPVTPPHPTRPPTHLAETLTGAATVIQRFARGHLAREHFRAARASVVTLQAGARGMLARAEARRRRREAAAVMLQTAWRRHKLREEYKHAYTLVVAVQAMWRGKQARGCCLGWKGGTEGGREGGAQPLAAARRALAFSCPRT